MSMISFIDDNMILAKYYLQRDYSKLSRQIKLEKGSLTKYIERQGMLAGYTVSKNEPLSNLYHGNFFVVRFSFADFQTEHMVQQEELLLELMQCLKEYISEKKGYYNLRIPSHVVDIIRTYNNIFKCGLFCGGTVEEIINGKIVSYNIREKLNVFFADEAYIKQHFEELLNLTFNSFKEYHGQYHISPYTEKFAGKIYENWIYNSLKNNQGDIVIADYLGMPIGFITLAEKENAVEGVLNAVDEKYRNIGAYRAMLCYAINEATRRGKSFVISTQLDNFIVQGVWNSVGLRPFYSVYNMHVLSE